MNTSPQGTVSYYDNSGKQYSSSMAMTPSVKITITAMTSSYVSGTFSGNAVDINSASSVTITNG